MKICPACEGRFDSAEWACAACGWRAPLRGAVHEVLDTSGAAGFSATFFDSISAAEDRHFWLQARNAIIAGAVSRHFPGARTLLDVGCGTGHVTRALQHAVPGVQCTAADAFSEGLAIAERKAQGIELVRAHIERLPWEDEFDVVGAFDVIEHVADDAAAIRQLARAARPGGGVIVTVPQHQWLWSPIDDYSGHQRRYSRAQLVGRLRAAGLRVERVTSFVTLLLPALVLSRFSRRGSPPDPDAEVRLSPALNAIGAAAMRLERAVLDTGVSLPAGGSLLAVARRPGAQGS